MDKYKPSWEETHKKYADNILTDPALHPANTPDDIAKLKYAHALFTGEIREPDKGFWGELSDEAALAWNRGWRGIYNTFGSDSNVKRLDDELRINPEWNAPDERGVLGTVGGFIGSGIGSSGVVLPGMIAGGIAGTAAGGPAGTFLGILFPFVNSFLTTYGDTVDRYKQSGLSDDVSYGAAVLESGAMAAVETLLGTVPALGKLFKGKSTAGVAQKILGKLSSGIGDKGTKALMGKIARGILSNGAEEGFEEALQYLIETTGQSLAEAIGQDKKFSDRFLDNFSWGDLGHNTLAGTVAGIALGTPGEIKQNLFEYFGEKASKETVPPASVPNYIRTDTAPAEESSSVDIRTTPSPSVQTPSDTTAPTAAQSAPQYIPAANTAVPAVNTTAEEVKARVDSMSDDAVVAAASRMGIPGVATEPVDVLRDKVEERMIAEAMTAAPSETAPVRTPVIGENSISRETLTPGQTPLAPSPANIPSPSAAAPVDIQSAPAAAQSAPQVPEYTRTPQVTLPPEYTGNPADGSFEPQNVSAYTGEVSNGDFDTEEISNYPETPMPVFRYQPSEVLQRDQRAIEAYQEELPGQMISPASNSELSKDEKDVLTAVQRISRALGVSKAMPVKSVVTDPKKAAIFDGAHLPGGEDKETGVRRNLLNMSTSQSPAELFHAAMHELTHSLIEKDKAAYNKLLNEILPLIIDKKELKARLQNYARQRGLQWGKLIKEERNTIEEEFICDTVADLMQSERFWDVLSQKDMTLAQKFLKALKDLLAKFKGGEKYLSRTEKVFGDNLQEVIALAQQFVVEASGKKDLNALFRGKAQAQTATQAASAENLSVPPESDQSVPSVSSVSSVPSVQTPSDTAAPVEQVPEQVGEQGKKKKITKADLNKQAKDRREAKQGKAETAAAEQTDNTAPVEWGERHDDLANSGSRGVAELRKRKSGWIPNAWVRDDIGGIALPYGKTDAEVKAENKGRKTGYGLAHIDERHPDLDWDLADDAIRNGKITDKSGNRIILEHTSNDQKHRVVVQIDFDQISQNWLVTVYKKVAESPANPLTTAHDNKGVADNITPENSADNTIPQSVEKSSGDPEKIIDKITSAKAGSRERIMAFTELPDGEHTVNGKSFTKKDNAFTLDGKTLNAKEIEKATRTTSEKMRKTVEETVSDAEVDYTPKAEAQPEDKPTLSDKMRGKGKKKADAKPAEQSEVSEKSDQSDKAEKIEDYGEKIGGARKDQYKQEVQSRLEDDLSDEEIYNLPASKVFPIPDYAKLAEQGVSKKSLALLKALREAFFPNKPTTRFKSKVARYVKEIKNLRSWAIAILKDADAWEKDIVAKNAEADKILKDIAKLEEEENKLRKDGFDYYSSEWREIIQKKSELTTKRWEIQRQNEMRNEIMTTGKALAKLDLDYSSFNSPYIVDSYTMSDGSVHYRAYEGRYYLPGYSDIDNTNFDAVVKLVADEIARKQEAKQKEKAAKGKLDPKKLYIKIAYNPLTDENSYAIYNVKDGFRLKDGFETREDAQKYASSEKGFAELSKRWDEISDIKERRTILSDRVGTNYRNGKNITPQELAETFGFRGIEFGKWAEQEHRQARLNETFDALMDMAAILGISPRAVSLGGKLGLAFGARGRGNAMAHFESEKFVINLTKTMGAGSLAHEWLHALDNYFAKQTGRKLSMSTNMQFSSLKEGGMRDELAQAYRDLVVALQMSDMMRRSRKHSKYWSRIWEVAARAFERYVVDEAAAQNTKNDFLSSVLTEKDMSELMQETTPLALDKDMKTIAPAFDKFFATLQEKTDSSGNSVLFSKQGDLQQDIEEVNQKFNDDLDRQIAGTLPKGYIHQLGTPGDILLSTGVPNLPIELSSTRLEEKSKQENHPFDIADLKNLPKLLQEPIGVFAYGNKDNAQNIIIEVQQNGRNYLVGLSFNFEHDGLVVNSIRGLFAKETAFWLRWIEQGKTLYINKEKVQNLIAQQRTNLADVNNLDLNSINNIIQNFENPSVSSKNPENSSEGEFTENDGSTIKFSLRNDRPPQKTKTGYKVFAVFKSKPGELFPPVVPNPGGESTPTGVWLDADAAPRAKDSKTGRPRVQAGGKGTNVGKQELAYRPGWHLGAVPQALQFNRKNPENGKFELFPANFVWAECEIAADIDYQEEAESYGYNASGKFQHSYAGLPRIPENGYYSYRTNPKPETEPWFITGAMIVKRLLTDTEINEILKANGYPEMKRQGGEMNLSEWGFDTTDFRPNLKFSKPGDLQMEQESKKQKSSTVAKSSTGISQPFPDYRGLPSDEKVIASAALQFVKHIYNIASDNSIVKNAVAKIKTMLEDIENGTHIDAKSFITKMNEAGFVRSKEGGSAYLQIDNKSTTRLSNHSATASTFVTIGEKSNNISIVLRSATSGNKEFKIDDNVNLLELQFGRKHLDKTKLPVLLADIAHFMATGDYIDNVGAVKINTSGSGKFKLKALEKLYNHYLKQNNIQSAEKAVREAAKQAGYNIKAYHGTNAEFYVFDPSKFGLFDNGSKFRIAGVDSNGKLIIHTIKDEGFFFSAQEAVANDHAEGAVELAGGSPRTIAAYLKAEKPLIIEMDKFYAEKKGYDTQDWYDKHTAEILDEFHKGDYDSIWIKNPVRPTKDNLYIVFQSEQIKSAEPVVYDDNGNIIPLSERFNPEKDDIRFSLTGDLDLGDTSLSPEDYRRSIDPLFDFVMEYTDGIVNPGSDHIGEDFDGSYISEAYNKFSTKRKQGKKESDSSYQRYLAHRQEMLNKADGYPLDTLAAAYVDKFGGDEKEVAEKILDMLRYLRKRDLISDRAEARQEVREFEKEQRKEDIAAMRELKEKELTAQVNDLFEAKEKPLIDKRWVQMHRQIYPKLYQTVFPLAKNVPDIPSRREMDIINLAIANGSMSEAAQIAEPYYNDETLQLKSDMDQNRTSTVKNIWGSLKNQLKILWKDKNAKEDINFLEELISMPMWLADKLKEVPAVKAIYQAAQDYNDDKSKITNHLVGDLFRKLDALRKDKKAYKAVNEYLVESDRNRTGAGKIVDNGDSLYSAFDGDGKNVGEFTSEEEAAEKIFDLEHSKLLDNGFSLEQADAVLNFRQTMYRTYKFRTDTTKRMLRQLGLANASSTSFTVDNIKEMFPELANDETIPDSIDIFKLMAEMGQHIGYYMPRIRHGRYMLRVVKNGVPVIIKGFDSKLGRAWEAMKLRKKGYKVENFLSNAPDQDMLSQTDPAAMMDILNQAISRANEKLKNEFSTDEVIYTKRDGSTEIHLVLSPSSNLNTQTVIMLKDIGGKLIDGAWHFVAPDAKVKDQITEILSGQVMMESKMQMLMQSAIGESIVAMIRENSSGSSKIQRRTAVGDQVARGYEEDITMASALYLNGIAGSSAKNLMAKKMYSAFGGMDFDKEKYVNDLIPADVEYGTPEYYRAKLSATSEYYKEVRRRALDSSKQPRITRYMAKYIKDMLRNTTGIERVLGTLKGTSAVWMLNKPSSALNNLFGAIGTNPAVINNRTKCGLGFASKNYFKGMSSYWNYLTYNKWGKGTAPTGEMKEIFDIIHTNGWDGADLCKDAVTAGLTFAGKSRRAFNEKVLISSRRLMERSMVDLPEPEGPMITTFSPRCTSRETS